MTTALIHIDIDAEVNVDLYAEKHDIAKADVPEHIRQFINTRLEGLEVLV